MNMLACPNCGLELIEDASEDIVETENGDFIFDAYPVYKCRGNCGYMKRMDPVPSIIAQQGDDRLLLLYPDEKGRILDLRDSLIWPPMQVDSILARVGWEEYTGNHNVELLLENVRDSQAAFIEPPNLFQFATSELSQDAFLCWLMSWSASPFRSVDRGLHESAFHFISKIFNIHNIAVPTIETINITRQFKSLDILAIVNDTYAILIEDKTYTKDHSNQLTRYREAVKKEYPNLIQLPIYYKIADQSHYRSLDRAGYIPFKRNMMLEVLKKGMDNGVQNTIFVDYYRHLQKLEEDVLSFRTKPVSTWGSFAWQGFYRELQKEIEGDWGYVSNKAGGFWGFWWDSKISNNFYMQLEQDLLCVKIKVEDDANKRERRTSAMKEILNESEKNNLSLQKPARLGSGKTMTIAQRPNYIQLNADGTVDIKRTIQELKKY